MHPHTNTGHVRKQAFCHFLPRESALHPVENCAQPLKRNFDPALPYQTSPRSKQQGQQSCVSFFHLWQTKSVNNFCALNYIVHSVDKRIDKLQKWWRAEWCTRHLCMVCTSFSLDTKQSSGCPHSELALLLPKPLAKLANLLPVEPVAAGHIMVSNQWHELLR